MEFLHVDHGPHGDGASAGSVRVFDALVAKNGGARGGEVGGALYPEQQCFEELFARGGGGVIKRPLDAFGNLAKVMRRNVGGHTDGDT